MNNTVSLLQDDDTPGIIFSNTIGQLIGFAVLLGASTTQANPVKKFEAPFYKLVEASETEAPLKDYWVQDPEEENLGEAITGCYQLLAVNQKPIDPEFDQILIENMWDWYVEA